MDGESSLGGVVAILAVGYCCGSVRQTAIIPVENLMHEDIPSLETMRNPDNEVFCHLVSTHLVIVCSMLFDF